ncbi:hypothetical protein [Bradyrhizobium ottawaense]|uniref:Uncharacterized protein n=1 Tax=Bradyrhizobium ottawaense TaxID=931866 RepID=A0ABY0QHG2_9BRAD|nr:hypothetical protein [Bradyrhizobium ottawaense]SDK43018.1 hypothetical protein SAMN05444163_8092 [Bradyrhizobium ottawaense]
MPMTIFEICVAGFFLTVMALAGDHLGRVHAGVAPLMHYIW